MIRNSAPLDPDTFRHEAEEAVGKIQISQVDHPFQVRGVSELHVPCACGRPLVGVDMDLIHGERGYALHFQGICLTCGRQSGLYMSEGAATVDAKAEKVRAEVEAMVRAVQACREGSTPEPSEREAA